mgnify:CR=1 FL=1
MNCKQCEKELKQKRFSSGVLESPSMLKRRKFCDQDCMAKAMIGVIKNLTPQNSRRQSAKIRGEKCENCGSTSRLHVHHTDHNPLNNDKLNLQTLCAACHMKAHWRKWKATTRAPKHCLHCERLARHNGLCNTHWTRFRTNGNALVRKVRGKGGKYIPVIGP